MKEQRLGEISTWNLSSAVAPAAPGPGEEELGPFTERQSAVFWFQIGLTQALGKYMQDASGEGAHYFNSRGNPFVEQGLICENCAFFETQTTCEIVDGNIDPQGLCKNWVIPEGVIIPESPDGPTPEQQKQKAEYSAWKKMKKKPKKKKKWAY